MTRIGAILLHGSAREWQENVALFRRMRGQVAKVHLPLGFNTSAVDIEALITRNPQLTDIIYRTADTIISAEVVQSDLIERGIVGLIERYPEITHWIEVGNEVEHTRLDHWVYRWLLLDTVTRLRPRFPALRWIASMPTRLDHTIDVLAGDEHGRVEGLYDALAFHVYGHQSLGDGGDGEWLAIYNHLLTATSLPLVLSEFGINDPTISTTEKGRRYLDWLSQQPDRLVAATVFVIGAWGDGHYRVDAAMADVLGSRSIPTPQPEPQPEPEPEMTRTLGATTVSQDAARAWLVKRGAHQRMLDVLPIIYEFAPIYEVPAETAVAQIGKETNWGKFTGVVPWAYHNWCGLKTRVGGSDSDPKAHQRFANDREGIEAYYQHIARYGGKSALPAGRALLDPRWHLVTPGSAPNLEDLGDKWAPAADYGRSVANLRADLISFARADQQPPEQEQPMPRIIVSAGHENIRNITAAKIGASSQANLRGGTGAGGVEATWTAPWADHLAHLLRQMGADVVRTDAIYHADVYGKRADLVISGHCDGTGGRKRQHCQAAAVVSGNSYDSADARAQQFVDLWYSIYPQAAGIHGDGPITVGMRQYYGGWYRTPDSPMVLLEHQILADNQGVRDDGIDPVRAAEIDAEVVRRFFGLAQYQDAPAGDPNAREFKDTGHWIINIPEAPMLAFYEAEGGVERFGYPLSGMVQRDDGVFEQLAENVLLEAHPKGFGPYPGPYVRIGGLGQRYMAALQRIKELEAAD